MGACVLNEREFKDALVALLDARKIQTELIASTMAEIAAVRESIRALDPTFDDTLAEKRRIALKEALKAFATPIAYIDELS
jgi:hypothetical protein